MGAERLVEVMNHGDVFGVVEVGALEEAGGPKHLFKMLVALLGERDLALLLIEFVILRRELRDVLVDGVVEIRLVVEGAGDDQRRPRLVDQDRVDFVDDGEVVPALDHLFEMELHVVAQVIETQFVVGAVGDVAGIHVAALAVAQAMDDDAGGQAEEAVDLAHPAGVTAGKIVVNGDDMDAAAGEGVEVDRERGYQRLAFTGFHLGDAALVENHAADQLDVEMALPQGALGGLPDGGKSLNQQIIEFTAIGHLLAEHGGAGAQFVVAQLHQIGFQGVDFGNGA